MLQRLLPRRISPQLLIVLGGGLTISAVFVVGLLLILSHYFWPVEKLFRGAPDQPVPFPHPVHVQQAGIDCVFCHRTVETERMASIPAVEQCYYCHKIVGQAAGENAALVGIATMNELVGFDGASRTFIDARPINWVRVHRLPDHVRFVHEEHVAFFSSQPEYGISSATCTICHGKVETMEKVRQDRDLRMGDCVDCHREYGAPTDCTTCHY